MKKIIIIVLSSLILSVVLISNVYAVGNNVIYDGRNIKVTGDENFQDLLPGETIIVEFEVRNDSAKRTNWYIANEAIRSFEDNKKAADGAYSYSLSYNGKELYDSKTVGGQGMKGLKQINDETNGAFFYLDSLDPKGSGTLKMTIGLDGESQANDYMNALADLQLKFAVEEESSRNVEVVNKVRFYIPKTGVSSTAGDDGFHYAYAIMAIGILMMSASASYLYYSDRKGGR